MCKLLILGYGRHGKDTVAELIHSETKLAFQSSSVAAAELIIYPQMKERYPNARACFEDRHNHRAEWYKLICEYNLLDPSRLAQEILKSYDIYVGMRSQKELEASKHLFDLIIWVDASGRIEPEPENSCTVRPDSAEYFLFNNGTLDDLQYRVKRLCKFINLNQ